jgi:hypothetical protein
VRYAAIYLAHPSRIFDMPVDQFLADQASTSSLIARACLGVAAAVAFVTKPHEVERSSVVFVVSVNPATSFPAARATVGRLDNPIATSLRDFVTSDTNEIVITGRIHAAFCCWTGNTSSTLARSLLATATSTFR